MSPAGFVVTEEKSSTLLTLIVDKKGIFGSHIAKRIHESITTVLVTAAQEESRGNTLVIPYTKTIPEIPEGDYSHMFFIWDGRSETLRLLEPVLQKASLDHAQFVFITDYHCYSEKLVRFIHQEYAKASIIFTGDVFGSRQYESTVTKFFHEAQKNGTIQLENIGLKHVYPVEFTDVVTEIVKVGFGGKDLPAGRQGKLLLACQRHGMTELSLAHILQKVDPLLKVDFKKEERQSVFLPEGSYLFDTHYDVVRKIQDAYTDIAANKKRGDYKRESFFSPVAMHQERVGEKKRKKRWIFVVFFAILLLLSPILFTLIYTGLGTSLLYAAQGALKTGQYQEVTQFSQTGENLFSTALVANNFAKRELEMMLLGEIANSLTSAIQTGKLLADLSVDGGKSLESFSRVSKGMSSNPESDFLTGTQSFKNALATLEQSPIENIAGVSLAGIAQEVQPLGNILDVSPSLFGFEGKKTYLVLFQNNMELRPGGGFIGSYALVTLDKGRVVNFQIHNVYDADGQLKGHVEPPYVIRRYIPQVHWYLRDSNFDIDFSQDAASAAFFLNLETGQKVDGVIGVDLTFVKDILATTGPVYVPEYQQTVSSDNLFLLAETYAEKNSFAGSTQKQDFLSALFSSLQKRLTTSIVSPKGIIPLLSTLQSKDVIFGFSDPLIQDVFTVNGLSGVLWDVRKQDAGVINDFTGMNEANIGVNKANYFITRSVHQEMTIDKTGSVSGSLTIVYANSSQGNGWPGGDYKNYIRFILSTGAVLNSITIDGVGQSIVPAVTDFHVYEAKGFVPPKGLEVDSSTESRKQLYGFIVTVPAGKTKKVMVSYSLPKIDMSSQTLTYNGWLFKQPGVDSYPYAFSLTTPGNYTILQKSNGISGSGNTIGFTKAFGEDTQFSAVFSQK